MKNLVLEGCRSSRLWPAACDRLATDFCTNSAEKRLYISGTDGFIVCFSLETLKDEWRAELYPAECEGIHVTGMAYSMELDAVCVSLSSGSLMLVQCETHEVQEVGCVEGGIMAMQWSPDGDILALVTGSGNLLVMNQEWEALSEVALLATEASIGAFADGMISWRGDGKFFATGISSEGTRSIKIWDRSTLEVHSELAPIDTPLPALCWQPNGRHLYTAQHCSTQGGPHQKVLLYERNALAHGGFDLPTGSGDIHSLHWSPDSELLAVLLAPAAHVGAGDSSWWTLQIWHRSNWHWYLKQERRYTADTHASPSTERGQDVFVRWDEQLPGTLHVVLGAGIYERLALVWQGCVSDWGTALVVDGQNLLLTPLRHTNTPPPMCAARVRLPSPVTAVTLGGSGASADCELIAVALSEGRLALLASVEEDLWEESVEERGAGRDYLLPCIPEMAGGGLLAAGRLVRALCWIDAATLLVLAAPHADTDDRELRRGDLLIELSVRGPAAGDCWASAWGADGTPPRLSMQAGPVTYTGDDLRAIGLVSHGSVAGAAVVQGDRGQLAVYSKGGRLALVPGGASLPAPCPWMAAVPPLISATATSPVVGLAAAAGGKLFWGPSLVATEVTSFVVRAGGAGGPALMYTTRRSLLYTVYFRQLLSGAYQHRELLASGQDQPVQQQQQQQQLGVQSMHVRHDENKRDDDMRAAMHAAMKPSAGNAAARDVVVRAVEQGSLLVAAPRDSVVVVMQMPRGNLEAVSPRALVLPAITQALDRLEYAEAWRLTTFNRVDLNLIVDYRWPAILPQLPALARAIAKPSDLCDLLFALRPGSVVAPGGAYASILVSEPTAAAAAGLPLQLGGVDSVAGAGMTEAGGKLDLGGGKVDVVCHAMRAAVEDLPGGREKYLTVITTCLARQEARRLDLALACVRDAKEAELVADHQAGSTGSQQAETSNAERALRHLLLHVDADELYRVALGMYCLPLAYMVIANAQRDPGEYMEELQRFGSVADEKLQRHAIDMHLHRYPQAVKNLFEAGPQHFQKVLNLAREQGLLRLLLGLFDAPGGVDQAGVSGADAALEACRLEVLDAYGAALEADRKYEDAGIAYLAAGQAAKALAAYRAASQWRMVFVLARRLQYSEIEVQRLAVAVSDELSSSGQHAAGAMVLLHYLSDVDNAVSMLTQAKEWREALHTAYQHSRLDLVDTVVAPAAAAAAAGLLADARENLERISKYGARLKEVRGKREAMEEALAADAADGGTGEREDDAMTDVNSLMTSLSMYTENTHTGLTSAGDSSSSGRVGTASTQGGRRAQQAHKKGKAKGGKIRQGGPREEASLVEHMTKLAPSKDVLIEAGQLAELLVLLGHFGDARMLQAQLARWMAAHAEATQEIAKHPLPEGPDLGATPRPITAVAGTPEWKWAVLRDA